MIDYFLITHNVELNDKFPKNYIPNITVLLVGNNCSVSKDSIVCKNLPYNIEDYPNLCSYTAWYAVAKNKLYNNKTVSLLEYDIDIIQNFHDINLKLLEKTQSIIAYNYTLFNHYVFYKSTPWLEISLKKVYNINLNNFIDRYKTEYLYWPTTTNITMSTDILCAFINWYHPMVECFKHDSLGSYVHERAFFIFCVINNIKIIYPKSKTLTHYQLQSHKINDFYGKFLNQKNTQTLADSMLEEYNELYDLEMKRCLLTTQ